MSYKVICGDCLAELPKMADQSVNLIMTSPPYADRRKNLYGGIHPDKYVDWFLPITEQLQRVLTPDGSFILNLKEHVVNGERHEYVMDLVKALRRQKWLWTETYLWHKTTCAPGKWPNRFRDAWEYLYHFTKNKRFKMNQEAVRVPIGEWAAKRLENPSARDHERSQSATGSGFGFKRLNWAGRNMVYPSNVLYLNTEADNRFHGAVFPVALPEWFIRLFTDEGDTVLDPFSGSGTTGVAARRQGRDYIGIEIFPTYCTLSMERIASVPEPLVPLVDPLNI